MIYSPAPVFLNLKSKKTGYGYVFKFLQRSGVEAPNAAAQDPE